MLPLAHYSLSRRVVAELERQRLFVRKLSTSFGVARSEEKAEPHEKSACLLRPWLPGEEL